MHHTFIYEENNPVSLAIVDDEIFWTTRKSLKLNWTPKHTFVGTKTMLIDHPSSAPVPDAIQMLTISPLTVSKHQCADMYNGGCSHICIAVSESRNSCLCPSGMVFQDVANTTCINAHECYFRCGSGECVTKAQRCDGNKNCADRSDEMDCGAKHTFVTCKYSSFACEDGLKCK